MRRLPLYPLGFAAWPVLFLYRGNLNETPVREAVAALAVLVGVTALIYLLVALWLRSAARAAPVVAVLVVAVTMWGHVRNLLGEPTWLLYAWLLGTAVAAALALRLRPWVAEINAIATGVVGVLIVLSLVPVIQAGSPAFAAPRVGDEIAADDIGTWAGPGEPRDIYYLVMDRYGSSASLNELFGDDNAEFIASLERRGFVVAPDSRSNHLKTAQSLASTLNMEYLLELRDQYGPRTGNLLPVYDLLADHAVGRILRARGYEHVHIGAWWDPTQSSPSADVSWSYQQRSDFHLTLWETTLLSEVGLRRSEHSADARRRVHYDGALAQFEYLRQAAQRPGPTFTFAHILLPHDPFVFDREGNYVSLVEQANRSRRQNYMEQLAVTNRLLDGFLDEILSVPPAQRPIVIIQADEGPHPVRYKADELGFDWETATDAELREKFSILNAYYLPGVEQPPLYPSISPVNTWRVVFNAYFGADLPLLDDRSYIFRDVRHVYDFTDITDRVRSQAPTP